MQTIVTTTRTTIRVQDFHPVDGTWGYREFPRGRKPILEAVKIAVRQSLRAEGEVRPHAWWNKYPHAIRIRPADSGARGEYTAVVSK